MFLFSLHPRFTELLLSYPPLQSNDTSTIGVDTLIDQMKTYTHRPVRSPDGKFIFAIDHCFSIRGVGTVMTGTVHSGAVSVGDVSICPTSI